MINKIILGHALNVLPKLPAESVNCVTTSPPFWGLRDYGVEPVIWDGDKNCKHEWVKNIKKPIGGRGSKTSNVGANKNDNINMRDHNVISAFCQKCGAWRGSLGLEPTFDLYIKHLCQIFDEVKRVLRKDGTCWVNIGDSYGGSGNRSGHTLETSNLNRLTIGYGATGGNQKATKGYEKCLLDIPYRFSIEMTNRGWIKRNTIIWYKKNCMPSSANDRFTIDFEYLFFFTKNNKAIFWTNEKTLECVDKKPLGTKGIEGKDWEWRKCPKCSGTGFEQKWKVKDKDWVKIKNLHGECEKQGKRIHLGLKNKIPEKQKEICPRCKGIGKLKYSFWSGHDYWFDQQFEPILTDSIKRELRGNRPNKYSKDKHLPKGVHPNTMSQVREYRGYDNLEEEVLNRVGRNKRCVWSNESKYEIIVNKVNGENIFEAANIPYTEMIKCFNHWFNKEIIIKGTTWIIPTQPFPEAHFAVYPEELIEIPIKAGCPEFICKKCGKARMKIYDSKKNYHYFRTDTGKLRNKALIDKVGKSALPSGKKYGKRYKEGYVRKYQFKGYSDCGCNAGFEPGIVLDPFMGAGTTALVALKQRKRFIGIEIKQEYIDMSYKRIARVQQRIF